MEPFGIGRLYLQPNKDGAYIEAMVLQDVSWDFRFDLKELHGAKQFPVAVRRGKGTIEGAASYARIRSDVIAAILGAVDPDTGAGAEGGTELTALDVNNPKGAQRVTEETVDAIPGTPYAVTVAPPLTDATFYRDVAVHYNDADHQQLTQGATATGTGVYAVDPATGKYTFHSSDTTKSVVITYLYDTTEATLVGDRYVEVSNGRMGATPVMRGLFYVTDNDRQLVLELEQVVPGGLKFSSAIDDWTKGDLPMRAFSDCNRVIGRLSVTDTEVC